MIYVPMAPRPMNPQEASLAALCEKFLIVPLENCVAVRRNRADDIDCTVIAAELAWHRHRAW